MFFKKFLFTSLLAALLVFPTTTVSAATSLNPELVKSIVEVVIYDSNDNWYSGTGFFLEGGMIVSNAHVILDESTGEPVDVVYICTLSNEFSSSDCRMSARVLEYDEFYDLAILLPVYNLDADWNEVGEGLAEEDIKNDGIAGLVLNVGVPELGSEVRILGFPAASGSSSIVLTNGIVSAFDSLFSEILGANFVYSFTTDATINPGNSGGPVINENDEVVGVATAVSTNVVGGSYGYVVTGEAFGVWSLELIQKWGLWDDFMDSLESGQEFLPDIDDQAFLDANFGHIDFDPQAFVFYNPFSDVAENNPNIEAIRYLKYGGIVNGYPDATFRPFNPLNRAELLKILMEGLGYSPDVSVYNGCFNDVNSEWFASYVCFAKDQGWVEGYEGGEFRPADSVNKVEAIKMLLEVFEMPLDTASGEVFNDVPAGEWFSDYINTAKNLDLLEEIGSYGPGDDITRGGISENIYRLMIL